MLWGHSVAFWDWWGFWLMITGAGIGAVALLVTLASSIILYGVTSAQQGQLRAEANAHGLHTLELEKEVTASKIEYERLKKQVAWRELNKETRSDLLAKLSTHPSSVTIIFIANDVEATAYCAQFVAVFRQAKWTVEIAGRTFLGPPVGVVVTQNDVWNPGIQTEIEWLRAALVGAGISVEKGGGAVEARVPELSLGRTTAKVRLVVGHKRPPTPE